MEMYYKQTDLETVFKRILLNDYDHVYFKSGNDLFKFKEHAWTVWELKHYEFYLYLSK